MAEPKLPTVPEAQNVQIPAQPEIPTFEQEFKPMTSEEYLKLQQQPSISNSGRCARRCQPSPN